MPSAQINGVQLHYRIDGDGPPVVWLHGLLNSIERAHMIGEGMERLAQHGFRVVMYDARGHGESGYTDDQAHYTWQAHAHDMLGLLDHLGIERAIIGGGSMGAGVSVTFAIAHPERVEALLLLIPPPLADTIGPAQQIFGGLASLIESQGVEQAANIVMQLSPYKEMEETEPERRELIRQWMLGIRPDSSVAAIRGLLLGSPLVAERFGEIAAPTLIIAHPEDPIHPLSTADRLHEAIAGSRLVAAPRIDYYRDHQDELLTTAVGFLRGEDD
ncbi:MAG: alpha/beta hydrolase [Dehalococcoidia bacterium]